MATRQTCLGVDVLDLLKRCGFPKANWYELGLRLGLRKSTLDAIETKHRGDVYRCMTECLSQWLSRADNVDSRGGANLDSLSDALRSMNETAVAEKLKHHVLINIFNNRHTVLSQSLCDPVGVAQLLYGERMLTQEAVSRVVSASPSIPNQREPREALLTGVKEAVETDPNSLHTFANVLCTISTNVSLGQAILDDISKYFPTPEVGVVPETIKDHDVVPQDNTSTDDETKTTQSETHKENETFKKYNDGDANLKISVVDLSTGEVGPAEPVRSERGWTVGELKQHIGEVFNINSSCMRLVGEEYDYWGEVTLIHDVSDAGKIYGRKLYVSSDPEDYQKEFKDSLMYKYVEFHIFWILLDITIPPGPEATPTTTNVTEGGTIMKIISINEENKGKERKIQVRVDWRITIAELKEELVPLIGVPSTGFIVYGIRYDGKECELEGLRKILQYLGIKSGSKLIVRLGRGLGRGEERIKLYLLQVNNTEFCKFMMESIVAKGTTVREFKKRIIEEAKVQGIDCVLELDKMRLRDERGVSPDPGSVYVDYELINTNRWELYVEPLKGPEKMKHNGQKQVYVIRWHPSQCSVDPIEEIILDTNNYDDVIPKLSELSGVPVEYISYTEDKSFPVEISCLDIENKLNWYSISSDRYPFRLYFDGHVIYYKDNRETMKELTDKERSEIQEAEEARLKRIREYKSQLESHRQIFVYGLKKMD